MRSALTRLTLLVGASILVCVLSGPGVALAACPACNQYIVHYPTVHPKKHTSTTTKRHKTTGAVNPGTSTTTTTPTSVSPPVTGETPARHTTAARHHKPARPSVGHSKSKVKHKPASSRRGHVLASKRLTVAAATSSGGGIGVWLLVILALVLVTGSTAGVLRYRRNHR